MNKAEKKRFIRQLIRNVQNDLIEAVDRLPEEWDGIELRELIADRFDLARAT